jgi:hypothetical protein
MSFPKKSLMLLADDGSDCKGGYTGHLIRGQLSRNPVGQESSGQSGQMILQQITHFLDILYRREIIVEICWIPAHTGVQGNEKANIIAK